MAGTKSVDVAALEDLVQRLARAWNVGDAREFAAPFAEDADFVNVNGLRVSGRDAIHEGHAHIFATIYAGSRITYGLARSRPLTDAVALLSIDAVLEIPAGAMAGTVPARVTATAVRQDTGWSIAAWQTTSIREVSIPPGGR